MEIESGKKLIVVSTNFFFFLIFIFVIDFVPGTDPHMAWRAFSLNLLLSSLV